MHVADVILAFAFASGALHVIVPDAFMHDSRQVVRVGNLNKTVSTTLPACAHVCHVSLLTHPNRRHGTVAPWSNTKKGPKSRGLRLTAGAGWGPCLTPAGAVLTDALSLIR